MCVRGFDLRKLIAGVAVIAFVFLFVGCKQSESEKNEALVKAAMPELVQQKDSLSVQVQDVHKEFQVLKNKVNEVPEAVLKQPEHSKLAETLEALEKKYATIEGLIPAIEAKLKALEETKQKSPSAEVEHEITVMKQLLEAQRNRMDNYIMNYRKLAGQLDSIQKTQ